MHDTPLPVRVLSLRDETPEIRSFELVPLTPGEVLPSWQPGAHVEVRLADGLRRSYSLCGSPSENNRYRIAVKRQQDSRGGSLAMHALKAGDTLHISAPLQAFGLDPAARRHLLVAGGIGITPILSMYRALENAGEAVDLHYFARSEADAAFFPELERGRREGTVHGHFGLNGTASMARLHALFGGLSADEKQGLAVYTCGPAGLMTAVGRCAGLAGLNPAGLHQERFADHETAITGGDGSLARAFAATATARRNTTPKARHEAGPGLGMPTSHATTFASSRGANPRY